MRLPLSWLAEWVPLHQSEPRELASRLTQIGFEIEAIEPAAPAFKGVVVAQILSAERHPQADKLQVCSVSVGAGEPLQIVCGAANARAGLVTALARVGAVLPGDKKIGAAKLRGVESAGMLCSALELGLAEKSEGILELPADAPLGTDVRAYLDLDDTILEVNVTPNRGDAMSVLGLARELSALTGGTLRELPPHGERPAAPSHSDRIGVTLQPGAGAARFLSCVLHDVDNTRSSPAWLRERLRRAGVRSISAVVDVTNYVMLELGQPMHAYDATRLRGALSARRARGGECIELLDGREVQLEDDVLVIADELSAAGLAGVMGGARTAISERSRDVVLEVAWFKPDAIAGRARRYSLQTDASQRFERGVDWRGQERAMALAVSLITRLTGGSAGPVGVTELLAELPLLPSVGLRAKQLTRLLGADVAVNETERRLRALGMRVQTDSSGWQVTPPSWRFDIGIEPDLIEEVVRLGGLDSIAERDAPMAMAPRTLAAGLVDEGIVLRSLAARGYQEVITFGFVDPALQRQLFGDLPQIELANPIASDLAVMRSSLWPGLIGVARENLRRQQSRLRLFEIAHRFRLEGTRVSEQKMLAGLALGARLPEQWGAVATEADFFDLKGDLQGLLALGGGEGVEYRPGTPLTCLHPGRSARLVRAGRDIGVIGELHPALVRTLDLTYAPILFELEYEPAFRTELAQFQELSRFPQIRRDLSFTVPEAVSFAAIRERVSVAAGNLLKHLSAFDVYQGKGVETGRKSVALGLILQELSRTLTDEEADRVVQAVRDDLQANLDAKIRE